MKMNCGYCGRKCSMERDLCVPQDSVYVCKTCYDWSQKVANLETKLAESEKKFIVANNLRNNSDEVLLNYKTEKYGLDKTIQELRKMKLSLPEKEWYYKGFENCERQMSSHIADLTLEVKQLKQQLAEKDEEIEELRKIGDKGHLNDLLEDKRKENKILMKAIEQQDQDKIELLEKANAGIKGLAFKSDKCLNKKDCIEDCVEVIDTLIKKIKGE